MLRVLLIPLARCELPSWSLHTFQVECASHVEDGIQRLEEHGADAVVLVARGGSAAAAAVCARVEAACGPDVVPLLLAVEGSDLAASEALETLPFDALVDLAWDPRLIERCLTATVHRVRAGRGVAQIQQEVLRAVREEMAQLRDENQRDGLTGLYNLRSFRETAEREHARCVERRRAYALVCFDLDNLRELNNVYGHAVGTRALGRVGVTLATLTRRADYAFRVGGDEFVALLVGADLVGARLYAERVCSALRKCAVMVGGMRAELSVSAGIAVFPQDGDTLEAVLGRADAAMYRAKALGRDRIVTCAEAA